MPSLTFKGVETRDVAIIISECCSKAWFPQETCVFGYVHAGRYFPRGSGGIPQRKSLAFDKVHRKFGPKIMRFVAFLSHLGLLANIFIYFGSSGQYIYLFYYLTS